MTECTSELREQARQWAASDPDPATSAELTALLEALDHEDPDIAARANAELADAFSGALQFGTAGLRAPLGPGPARMNRVVVRQAAAGLAAFLLERAQGNALPPVFTGPQSLIPAASPVQTAPDAEVEAYVPRIVVGFDARHNSEVFAHDSAAIFAAAGLETFLMPAPLPTPLLAFAVRALGCEGGVMVTASHNPRDDNGYKVYLGGRIFDGTSAAGRGAQIVPPFDGQIAEKIRAVGPVGSIALAQEGWQPVPDEVLSNYRRGLVELLQPSRFPARQLRIVHTAMHGVGADTAESVLQAAGFHDLIPVDAQRHPDPNFPTVEYPNPEEPGALDLALERATHEEADLLLALDPDADRLAVAAPDRDGHWQVLTGDEVGVLLGGHMVGRMRPKDADPSPGVQPAVFGQSLVSSQLLGALASRHGIEHHQTLTGFKWIARLPGLSYGYEEALGYCMAPALVRDKDGISAGLLMAELAADLKAQGRCLWDALDDVALEYGLYTSRTWSVRLDHSQSPAEIMRSLRENPPSTLAGSTVAENIDVLPGTAQLPPSDMLIFRTEDSSRVIVRPSGTEPKLKCYIEVRVPVTDPHGLSSARSRAAEIVDQIQVELATLLNL